MGNIYNKSKDTNKEKKGGKKIMEKRKNVLKEAVVLLIATILVLTALVIVPMTVAQSPAHDVGVTGINSPVSGPAYEGIPLEVTVENFGINDELNVPITMDIDRYNINTNGWVDECTFTDSRNINALSSITFPFFDYWTPDFLAYGISGTINYKLTAYTQLPGDEYPDNNCTIVEITLDYWHDVSVVSIETCRIIGTHPVYAVFKNRGTFPEQGLTANVIINNPNGDKICDRTEGGIILDEPLGGIKEVNLGDCAFTQAGTYEIIVSIPLANDDFPGNNRLTFNVEIVDIGALIEDLKTMVKNMNLFPHGAESNMNEILDKAIRECGDRDYNGAIDSLDDFKDRVDFWNGQPNCSLTDEQAAELKAAADSIIAIFENCN